MYISIFLTIIGGFCLTSEFFWLSELFSHFIFYITLGLSLVVIGLMIAKKHGMACLVLMIGFGCWWQFYHHFSFNFLPPPLNESLHRTDDMTILQLNINRNNPHRTQTINWLKSYKDKVDMIVLFEVTKEWYRDYHSLKAFFPYHLIHPIRENREIAILSHLPLLSPSFPNNVGYPMIEVTIKTPLYSQPVSIYTLHPPPPLLPSNASARNLLLEMVGKSAAAQLTLPKLIIGDLNISPYSPHFKKLLQETKLLNSYYAAPFSHSWPSLFPSIIGIQIDHLLMSNMFRVRKKTLITIPGSDHRAVMTHLSLFIPKSN